MKDTSLATRQKILKVGSVGRVPWRTKCRSKEIVSQMPSGQIAVVQQQQ